MTVNIKEILNKKDVVLASGAKVQKTQFMTETNEVLETFAKVEQGQSYDGNVTETAFGKIFRKNAQIDNKQIKQVKSDPDTMLIAYAEHIVSSFIEAGVIKDPKEAAHQISNFAEVFFKIFDARKSVKR